MKVINVAIDGPAGAGKSSVAKLCAKELGFIYIDTGALYRAIGVAVLRKGLRTDCAGDVIPVLSDISLELAFVDGEQRVILNGEDVSRDIRLPEASMAASNVSAIPKVRSFLLDMQKRFARENNCLTEKCADLCSANIKCMAIFCYLRQANICVFGCESITKSCSVKEKLH